MNGMRFLIKREEPVIKEATEDTPEEKGEPIFHAVSYTHLLIFPALTICIIVLTLNLIGDGLRDAFDPKLSVLKVVCRSDTSRTNLLSSILLTPYYFDNLGSNASLKMCIRDRPDTSQGMLH